MRSIDACENCEWTIATWRRSDGEALEPRVFRCKSWRHAGECRMCVAASDFARIAKGLESRKHWTYLVLTYPRFDYPDLDSLFRAGKDHWYGLRKRLEAEYGKLLYIQTWEVHKSMYPHVNVTVSSERFYDAVCSWDRYEDPKPLQRHAIPAGFGKKCWAEAIRSAKGMANYLTKLGLELAGQSVKGQVPVNAPRHFRRIRASRGVLPPRVRDPDVTGQLFKMKLEYLLEQLNKPNSDPGGFELEEIPEQPQEEG